MLFPARQLPDEPGVYRTEEQLASLGLFARAGHVVEYPFYLRRGKICVDKKSRRLLYVIRQRLVFLYLLAQLCRAPALPDYRVADGNAGLPVPDHCRFALIGYAYRRNALTRQAAFCHCLRKHIYNT